MTAPTRGARYPDPVTPSSATRRANDGRTRRVTKLVLVVGSIVAALLGTASLWVPVTGIVGAIVAIIAGIAAVTLAWRELLEYGAQRNAEAREAALAQTEQLRQLRSDHTSVMHVLSARNGSLRGQLREARAENGELQAENSRLRGDIKALRVEVTDLRAEVGLLQAVHADEAADVVTLPRRRASEDSVEGWEAAEAETVIDLDLARLATPFVEDAVRRHAN